MYSKLTGNLRRVLSRQPDAASLQGVRTVIRPSRNTNGGVFRRLLEREDGGVAILFMFMITGLFGFVGLSIDTSMWYSTKVRLQGAADAAARAGAYALERSGATQADVQAAAEADAALNGFTAAKGATIRATVRDDQAVEAVLLAPGSLNFARLFTNTPPTIRARAVAASPAKAPPCLTI